MDQSADKRKFSSYFYNPLTFFGALFSFFIFLIECLLFGVDFFSANPSVYLGIITYTVLPPFLLLGLCLIPLGALRSRRRVMKGEKAAEFRRIFVDLGNPAHRNALFIFVVGTTTLIIMSAVGSYQAFHYTESVHFCGITCHDVMAPQYTRYTQSAHARVKCVECHIGSGADWYMRSKLSGVRQVFATAGNTFPRPVPSPVHNLRPASETCEQCHWPEKPYSSFELRRQYFLSDAEDKNAGWFLRMLLRTGSGGDKETGIHAHMNVDNAIYYVAEDEGRQDISWVKAVDKSGKATVYTTGDSAYKNVEPPPEKVRRMDCIDCHNRATHRFLSPDKLANQALLDGAIDANLPTIKAKAVSALSGEYSSYEEAADRIRQSLEGYYKKALGDAYSQRQSSVKTSMEHIIAIYKNNFFPAMKARWDVYPDNIGHFISPGCFRCHGGEHASKEGKIISRECTACHTIIEQGPPGQIEKSTDGLPFRHPVDIGEAWKDLNCYECHTGGS